MPREGAQKIRRATKPLDGRALLAEVGIVAPEPAAALVVSPDRLVPAVRDSLQGLSVRDELLKLAGIDRGKQAELLTLGLDKLQSLLSANSVQRLVVNSGLHRSEVVEFIDADSAIQARAAGELLKVVGAYPSRSSTDGSSKGPTGPILIQFVDMGAHHRARQALDMGQAQVVEGVARVIPPSM